MATSRARLHRAVWRWLALLLAMLAALPGAPVAAQAPGTPDTNEPLFGIVDAFRRPKDAAKAGATWDRVLFLWQQIQPGDSEDFDKRYLPRDEIKAEVQRGIEVTAVLQGTPQWAALNRPDGAGAVPRNLDKSSNSDGNYWARFVEAMVQRYRGTIKAWIIWNEPDFRPEDPGEWWTWAGSPQEYYALLKRAWQTIKREDPKATVVFAATAFWPDATAHRPLFLERVLEAADKDPDAREHDYYFDAVAVNLYCSDSAIAGVHATYERILASHGLSKPIWLTETNCAPYDDPTHPMPPDGRITQEDQAGYLVRALATARVVGYERMSWYSLIDRPGLGGPWGLLRENGERRPAYYAYQLVTQYLGRDRQVFAVDTPPDAGGPDLTRIVSQGADDRVQVFWNNGAQLLQLRLPARSEAARLIDSAGEETTLRADNGWWRFNLPPGRDPRPSDPPGFPRAGRPVFLVEDGVEPGAPLPPLRVGPTPAPERTFPGTDYSVEDDRFWAAFQRLGAAPSLGQPVSFAFPFQGHLTQLFERGALQLGDDGRVRVVPLAATVLRMPHLAGVPLPLWERPLPARSTAEALARLQREVPPPLLRAYLGTARCGNASGCDPAELALERFGLPLGPPVADPARPGRVYQRFENAVLWADGTGAGEVPLGWLLRSLLLGRDVPPALLANPGGGELFAQYDPTRPRAMARPDSLRGTDLRGAF